LLVNHKNIFRVSIIPNTFWSGRRFTGSAEQLRFLLAASLILFAGIFFLAGTYYLGSFRKEFMSRTHNALLGISGNRAMHIKNWREDRLKDAILIQNNTRLNNLLYRFHANSQDTTLSARIRHELSVYLPYHPYEFFVLDQGGDEFFSWPENIEMLEHHVFQKYLDPEKPEVSFIDFYPNAAKNYFSLAMVVPIGIYRDESPMFLIARIDPYDGLFEAFRSYSARTVDVSVHFVFTADNSFYTFSRDSSVVRESIFVALKEDAHQKLFSFLGFAGKEIYNGTGFRGSSVLAAVSRVPDTEWKIWAEADEKTLFHDVRQRVFAIAIMGLAFLISIIALMMVFARRQELKLLSLSRENEILLDDLINNQPSGIYRVALIPEKFRPELDVKDLFGKHIPLQYEFVSKQHETITGISEKELRESPQRIFDAIHPEDKEGFFQKNFDSITQYKRFIWEGRIIDKEKVKWVRFDSVPRLNPPGQIIWTGLVMDITKQKKLESEMAQREAFERLLTGLSSIFVNISAGSYDSTLEYALGRLGQFCNTDRAYIFLLDKTGKIVVNTHEWCNDGVEPQKQNLQDLSISKVSRWVGELSDFNSISIYDVSQMDSGWEEERNILSSQGIKSVVSVPIISEKKLVGFVGMDSVRDHRRWLDYEIQMLRVFADLVYSALERRRGDQQLRDSQIMLRTILDTIMVRVFWKNPELKFQGCNKAFASDAGFVDPEELLGKDDFDMVWREQAEKFRADDLNVINNNQPLMSIEEVQTGPDGKQKWVRTTKIPLKDGRGEVIGVLGTYLDITAQKIAEEEIRKSEKKYRILTESAFDGIYLLRKESFEYVNQRFCEMTGYTYEELTSPDFKLMNLYSKDSLELALERQKARIQGIDIPSTYEMRMVTRSGKVVDIEISTNQLSGLGEEILILGIIRDITERKNNEVLRNEVAIATQSSIFKQNFLANMSHEIRTPLTGVLGMIEILSKTNLDANQADYVNTLMLSTENLKEIINQILDYSKIEAGEMHLKSVIFETIRLFYSAQKLFKSICRKDVELKIDISQEIPLYMEADENRLSQVINNLLSNAVKFTHTGAIVITAAVDKWINEREFSIKIVVEDSGIGIQEQALKKLFKPFGQVDHEDKRHFDGTGLGLSICKDLVDLMHGEIGVESTVGKGSRFWFTSRAKMADGDKMQGSMNSNARVENTKPLNILYGEDKPINQKVVQLMLNSMGHSVVLADDGQQVLDKYSPDIFDLILIDIQMPVMDGITATQILKQKYSKLPPVVGLSANAFEGDREKYMQQGLDEYLTKPVTTEDLSSLIKKLNLQT
jgi:PAS domain S-box-containing protein